MGVNNNDIAMTLLADADFSVELAYIKEIDAFARFETFDGCYYRILSTDDTMRLLWKFVMKNFPKKNITISLLKDVRQQLIYGIEKIFDSEDEERISFLDGNLNLRTFTLEEKSSDFAVTFHIPYRYADIAAADASRWKEFVSQVLVGRDDNSKSDADSAAVLQEIFGCCLLPTTAAETAFFFVGEGANGKSVAAYVLSNMIGFRYITGMSIETLTTNQFATSALVGKRLNISNEEESKYIRSDKFKALVSGDVMTAERKYGSPFEFSPRAKYVFCSNNLPTFDGVNYGTKRRLLMVPFNRRFDPAEQDRQLKFDIVKSEMPGVLAWAIEGAKRLMANNLVFTASAAGDEAVREFESESSSAIFFIRESYVEDSDLFVCNKTLYKEYRDWCLETGRKPFNQQNFVKDINRSFVSAQLIRVCPTHNARERGRLIRHAETYVAPEIPVL